MAFMDSLVIHKQAEKIHSRAERLRISTNQRWPTESAGMENASYNKTLIL